MLAKDIHEVHLEAAYAGTLLIVAIQSGYFLVAWPKRYHRTFVAGMSAAVGLDSKNGSKNVMIDGGHIYLKDRHCCVCALSNIS